MQRMGPKFAHVKQIYGAMDTSKFSPITDNERSELKKRFGINENTTIFLFRTLPITSKNPFDFNSSIY
jgi:hypothetical protein